MVSSGLHYLWISISLDVLNIVNILQYHLYLLHLPLVHKKNYIFTYTNHTIPLIIGINYVNNVIIQMMIIEELFENNITIILSCIWTATKWSVWLQHFDNAKMINSINFDARLLFTQCCQCNIYFSVQQSWSAIMVSSEL